MTGYCIRCHQPIDQDVHWPMCFDCYSSWEKGKNPKHQENYCHFCGTTASTSYENPLCTACRFEFRLTEGRIP